MRETLLTTKLLWDGRGGGRLVGRDDHDRVGGEEPHNILRLGKDGLPGGGVPQPINRNFESLVRPLWLSYTTGMHSCAVNGGNESTVGSTKDMSASASASEMTQNVSQSASVVRPCCWQATRGLPSGRSGMRPSLPPSLRSDGCLFCRLVSLRPL